KMIDSTAPGFLRNIAVPRLNEPRVKEQLLFFSVTDDMKNSSTLSRTSNGSVYADKETPMCRPFVCQTRHIILLIGTLCMMMILSNILILNVTIVCMTNASVSSSGPEEFSLNSALPTNESIEEQSKTSKLSGEAEFTYSSTERSSLFASMAGAAVLNDPIAV